MPHPAPQAREAPSGVSLPIARSLAKLEWLEGRLLLSSVSGSAWNDFDGDGARGASESALAGWSVYLDQNRNRTRDAGELFTFTDAGGAYAFQDLAPGKYYVAQEIPSAWEQTYPGSAGSSQDNAAVNGAQSGGANGPEPIGVSESSLMQFTPVPTTTGSRASASPAGESADDSADDSAGPAPADAQSNALVNLNSFRADSRFTGVDGSGYSVAVLDTGIDLDHRFFGPDADANGVADRIVYQYDFANGDGDASDKNGHGSNVAGIAAGQDAVHGGMAPGADVIALKVFTDAGAGNFSYIERALQWVVANASTYKIASVNMSLSDAQNHATAGSLYGLGDELAALASLGVVVVSAAGNDYYTFGSAQGVAYPASDPNSLAVSAVWDANHGSVSWASGAIDNTSAADRVVSFSQRSTQQTDIFAPGAFITGPNATGGTASYGGTSQAAPHIAGIAALAQQLASEYLGRWLGVSEFRELLRSSAVTIVDGDDENDNVTNTGASFGRVDVQALADAIYALSDSLPYGHTVTLGDADDRAGLNFGDKQLPTVPGSPFLNAPSDTGASSADWVTRFDNAGASRRLAFTVDGTFVGATVNLYAGGVLIGTAPAEAGATTVLSNGTIDLSDGAHVITARQSVPNRAESGDSDGAMIVVDTQFPTATAGAIAPVNGSTATAFTVTYTDVHGVDVGSIDGGDVNVTGPNGFDSAAALVSVSSSSDGSPRTATYSLGAPGGSWDGADTGSYAVVLNASQVADVAGNSSDTDATLGTFSFTVPPPQSPFKGSPFAVGASAVTIQAEDYDLGGQGAAFNDTTASNTGGAYRTGASDGVDLKLITNTTSQFRLGDTFAGEWLEYTINVAAAGSYKFEFRLSQSDPGAAMHAELDGSNLTGAISVPDTSSFSVFTTVSKTLTLPVGQHVLRLAFDTAAANRTVAGVDWVKITQAAPPPAGGATVATNTASYVRGGTFAAQNFGTSSDLIVKRANSADSTREAYLKFDLSSVSAIASAKLRLSAKTTESAASLLTNVYSSTSTSWSETGLTWNNKPLATTTIRGSFTATGSTVKSYEIDLTSFLKSELAAGRKIVTLVLKNSVVSSAQTVIASDETASGPQLIVT